LTPDRRIIFALFSITFGIRILYAVLVGTDPDIIPNPITYDFARGREIAEGANWLSQPISPRAPGYQLMLGALFSIGGIHQWLVIILQSIFGGVIAFMVYRIGEKALGKWVGLASALWFAVYVHQVHFTSIVVQDVTVGMLALLVCYSLIRYSRSMRGALWTAITYTVLVHFDPQYLLFLPALVLYYLFSAGRYQLIRVQHTFLFLGTVLMLLAPWTIRNYRVYGDPIPIALEATKYLPPVQASPDLADDRLGNGLSRPGFWRNSVEYWRVMRLVEGVQNTPGGGQRVVTPWSFRHNATSLVTYGLLLPFFLVGLWMSVKSRNRTGIVLVIAVVGMYLIRAFYGGTPRARLPAEPLLILLAFHAAANLYGKYRASRSPVAEAGEKVTSP
jgi:4-amino-4-deoxy-L-arabinose transferase-like glycosyltransferase